MVSLDFTPLFVIIQLKMGKYFQQAVLFTIIGIKKRQQKRGTIVSG